MKTIKKPSKVIMLPTEKAIIGCISNQVTIGKYFDIVDKYHLIVNPKLNSTYKYYHLYITSDDEIKEGDWVYHNSGYVSKCLGFNIDAIKLEDGQRWIKDCKKIIATTDKSLLTCNGIKREGESCTYNNNCKYPNCLLPQISQSFIEEYVKQGGIDEVMVEYENHIHPDLGVVDCTLKLNSQNEITIHLIEEKMYSKEEVIKKLRYFENFSEGKSLTTEEFDNWIKENL